MQKFDNKIRLALRGSYCTQLYILWHTVALERPPQFLSEGLSQADAEPVDKTIQWPPNMLLYTHTQTHTRTHRHTHKRV